MVFKFPLIFAFVVCLSIYCLSVCLFVCWCAHLVLWPPNWYLSVCLPACLSAVYLLICLFICLLSLLPCSLIHQLLLLTYDQFSSLILGVQHELLLSVERLFLLLPLLNLLFHFLSELPGQQDKNKWIQHEQYLSWAQATFLPCSEARVVNTLVSHHCEQESIRSVLAPNWLIHWSPAATTRDRLEVFGHPIDVTI